MDLGKSAPVSECKAIWVDGSPCRGEQAVSV